MPIQYTNAVFDETTSAWVSAAEVAEVEFTAFSSRKRYERITGRLVVRRIPELNPKATDGQPTLFDTHRYHAFFTTVPTGTLGTVEAADADLTHLNGLIRGLPIPWGGPSPSDISLFYKPHLTDHPMDEF